MLTFLITTSTKLSSISLYKNDTMLGNININVKKTHSTYIMDQIDSLLTWSQVSIDDIKRVIVSVGPGSFTGVRIAISVVKGLFVGKDVEIYTVNELDALAYQGYKLYGDNIISVIDSNKEKIYYGKYVKGKRIEELKIGKLDDIIEYNLNSEFTLVGDAVINYKDKLLKYNLKVKELDFSLLINSQTFYNMFKENLLEKVDIFNLVPDYLEKSQAEKEKNGNI